MGYSVGSPCLRLLMKALVIGATGATGHELLARLLETQQFSEIHAFGRRTPAESHPRLHSHVIDFTKPGNWAAQMRGDVLFACLGSTLKDAGSQDAQWQIDYQATLDAAIAARRNGTHTLVLMSAAGADAKSRFFYPRMKGALEHAVTELDFRHLLIFRPPLLLRPNSNRPVEIWSARILRGLNALGLLRSQQPLPVGQLAQAMLTAALDAAARDKPVHRIFAPSDIRGLLG